MPDRPEPSDAQRLNTIPHESVKLAALRGLRAMFGPIELLCGTLAVPPRSHGAVVGRGCGPTVTSQLTITTWQ
jgi:hypothetical protein